MKRSWPLVAAAALGFAGPARAASTVDFIAQQTAIGSNQVTLTVINSLDIGLGAVQILVDGPTSFAFAAVPNLSLPDSVYSPRPIAGFPWDALIANDVPSAAIVAPGQTLVLGTFTMPSAAGPLSLAPGETPVPGLVGSALGFTLFDTSLNPISAKSFGLAPCDECIFRASLEIVVPEPGALGLCGLAMGLALARQRRSGGKRRWSRASVGAPT